MRFRGAVLRRMGRVTAHERDKNAQVKENRGEVGQHFGQQTHKNTPLFHVFYFELLSIRKVA